MNEKLRELRKKSGMTQAEVAELLGVTQKTVSNLELGNKGTSLELALLICGLYGVSVEEVFKGRSF